MSERNGLTELENSIHRRVFTRQNNKVYFDKSLVKHHSERWLVAFDMQEQGMWDFEINTERPDHSASDLIVKDTALSGNLILATIEGGSQNTTHHVRVCADGSSGSTSAAVLIVKVV